MATERSKFCTVVPEILPAGGGVEGNSLEFAIHSPWGTSRGTALRLEDEKSLKHHFMISAEPKTAFRRVDFPLSWSVSSHGPAIEIPCQVTIYFSN